LLHGRLVAGLLVAAALLLTERAWKRGPRYTFERSQIVPAAREDVFRFFVNPSNLPRITPPWVGFELVHLEREPLAGGTMQEYRIHWLRVPLRWESLIAEFDSGRRFTDVQTRGPYGYWRHEHIFEDAEGGTLVRDLVQYEMPFGALGRVTHALLVRKQLREIFDYRANVVEQAFRSGR
jgi:ligand-binding SRPBCC domain-containing protein